METNYAAFYTAHRVRPLQVRESPLGSPGHGQILIKNHAVAINPLDHKLQEEAIFPLKFPEILGHDVAGEVIAVGPNVTRFSAGDRVMAHAYGFKTGRNTEKAFQNFTVGHEDLASKIPDDVSYERAVVLPMTASTAAAGLFQEDFMNLQLPKVHPQKPTGKVLLVWGGASCVGCSAIQFGVAAGYTVITTASPHNFALVKSLGASAVFDYHSESVIDDLVGAVAGRPIVGIMDAIGYDALRPCIDLVQRCEGVRFIATVTYYQDVPPPGVSIKLVFGLTIKDNHVSKAIYEGFFPKALENGIFVPAPEPLVFGKGLENVQGAMDKCAQGVSAQKVVVML